MICIVSRSFSADATDAFFRLLNVSLKEGGILNSTEFYMPQEDWPQQPEEKCTLEPIKLPTQTKKKKAPDTSRVKKKMSESLAGVTAAAVTVVMLSASIPILPEIVIDIPDYGRRETCPVCEQVECSYFDHGFSGLQISLGPDNYAEIYETYGWDDLDDLDNLDNLADLYGLEGPKDLETLYDLRSLYGSYNEFHTMQGFNILRPYVQAPTTCVETGEDLRLVLRLDNSLTADLYSNDWSTMGWQTIYSDDPEGLSYSGLFFPLEKRVSFPTDDTAYDNTASSATDYMYALISYDKTGENRLVEPYIYLNYIPALNSDTLSYNYITRDIPGVPNAQLQLVSSLDQAVLNDLFEYCSAVVVETKDHVFDLAKTMRFAETDSVYRTYRDHESTSISQNYSFFEGVPGDFNHSLTYSFPYRSYSIGPYNDILLSDVGWNNILDLVFELNQKAPETGHQVFFPAVEFNSCTVNNITYQCYLLYHEETYYNTYQALCFMIPQQEKEVAIRFETTLSAEQLENLFDTLDPATAFEISELLNQITLR